jgi:hypothetical protein
VHFVREGLWERRVIDEARERILGRDVLHLGVEPTASLGIRLTLRTEAIWHMLTRNQRFAPKAATDPLAA